VDIVGFSPDSRLHANDVITAPSTTAEQIYLVILVKETFSLFRCEKLFVRAEWVCFW